MKALIIKDWFVIWKQSKIMLLLALVYGVIAVMGGGYSFAWFSVVFLSILPITVMGLDERSKWDHYAVTMPYTRKDIVLSKYIFSIACALTAMIIYIIATIVKWYIDKEPADFRSLINQAISMLSVGLLFSTVNFPIMFKFGVDKGRMWFILITVILVSGIGAFLSFFEADTVQIGNIIQRLSPFVLPVIFVGLFSFSAFLSIKIYEKREL